MNQISDIENKVTEEYIKEHASRIENSDFEKVLNNSGKIESKFRSAARIKHFFAQAKLLISLVRDYWNGSYRQLPYWAIGSAVFTLLYVFNTFDLIMDFIPGIGMLDDAAVFSICLFLFDKEIQAYAKWKEDNTH